MEVLENNGSSKEQNRFVRILHCTVFSCLLERKKMGGGASSEEEKSKASLTLDECAHLAGPFWSADVADEIRLLLGEGLFLIKYVLFNQG